MKYSVCPKCGLRHTSEIETDNPEMQSAINRCPCGGIMEAVTRQRWMRKRKYRVAGLVLGNCQNPNPLAG